MAQYIDKDKVVAEIEKRKSELQSRIAELGTFESNTLGLFQDVDLYDDILSFLDTLETKEIDLKKEFYDFLDTLTGKDNGHLSEDELFRIAEYFYELGLTQKGE